MTLITQFVSAFAVKKLESRIDKLERRMNSSTRIEQTKQVCVQIIIVFFSLIKWRDWYSGGIRELYSTDPKIKSNPIQTTEPDK
jgi:hypothetical protein